MAIVLPDSIPPQSTQGNQILYNILKNNLPDDCLVFYELAINVDRSKLMIVPDFVVISPKLGVLVIEVKDWSITQIDSYNQSNYFRLSYYLNDKEYFIHQLSPLQEARNAFLELKKYFQKYPILSFATGQLSFPIGYGVVMSNITSTQAKEADFYKHLREPQVAYQEELLEWKQFKNYDLINRFQQMFKVNFSFSPLNEEQIETIQEILLPTSISFEPSPNIKEPEESAEPELDSESYPPIGEFDTQKALHQLKRERMLKLIKFAFLYCLLITGFIFYSGLGLGLMLLIRESPKELDKLSNLINVMEVLLDRFSKQGIEIIPRVPVSKHETGIDQVDLFIRFPQKVYFVLAVRKMESSKIIYHEGKERLMIRRSKGLSTWDPSPLDFMPRCVTWIKKNKRTLFGRSSNDKRRPTARILALTGSTEIGKHRSEFYDNVGGEYFFWIKGRSSLVIVNYKKNLCNFIEKFLESKSKNQTMKSDSKRARSARQRR